jgi:hypothetical protein
MTRYCKKCGEKLHFNYGDTDSYCLTCDKLYALEDTIAAHTRDARINQLKAMHKLIYEANDEGIYMTWIYIMPDCPSEDDFEYIAINDEEYNAIFDLFVKLIAKKGNRY